MLKRVLRSGTVLLALLLSACSQHPTPVEPIGVEATYRLLFNDALVGNALFILRIEHDGSYRIEAFTTPAGEMERADGHEVLESSRGRIDSEGVRPQHFEHSVMTDERIEASTLVFDWDKRVLRIDGKKGKHAAALPHGTQDHLSYLLTARQLALQGKGSVKLQIASADSNEQTQLQVVGQEAIDVPLGHYDTLAIRRLTSLPNEIRALWFDTGLSPLPLRVVHGWAGNTVDMQLESLSRLPVRPH